MDLDTRIKMSDGQAIPALGLGVWQIPDGAAVQDAIHWALEAGIRHIDTAKYYRNERGVGEAIRTSGIPREAIWVTTKLFPLEALWVDRAFHGSLKRLGLDYVDLYLVHLPPPLRLVQTWKKMESIAKGGAPGQSASATTAFASWSRRRKARCASCGEPNRAFPVPLRQGTS
jgi:methylglyoxal/glyoxal reductase